LPVIVLAASILMTVIALQYLRLQIRPIRRLGLAAEAYGRGRMLAFRPSGAREIRAAGLAFLDMRNRIERQNAQRKLMLSGLGHDMRTPLTRMRLHRSMMDDMEDGAALDAEIADLEKLLDRFLDYARGATTDRATLQNPADILRDLVSRYGASGQRVALELGPGLPPTMHLRDGQLERALDNLIGNALEYGTHAQITADAVYGMLDICVEDDGPGIAPGDRARALEPFVRLDSARNQDAGGHVGLGLAIAQDIARSHGGQLALEDGAALGGLRVRISLPLARDQTP
jgi:two-component system osmolarity sensor histidine kinase EnvZ